MNIADAMKQIKFNGNVEVREKLAKINHTLMGWGMGPHKITVDATPRGAVVYCVSPGINGDAVGTVHVMEKPFSLFGLRKYKPFMERLQDAVDKMQRLGDDLDRRRVTEIELRAAVDEYNRRK